MQGVISFIGFRGFSHVILHPKAGGCQQAAFDLFVGVKAR